MPAATSKSELRAVFDKEYAKLTKTLDSIDAAAAAQATDDDPTTIAGIIAHRTHWMNMFFTWYNDGCEGREVHIPAKGYKWNQLKAYNATLYEKGDRTEWTRLLSDLDKAAGKLRAFIDDHDDDELYTENRYPWTNTWTLGRWLEASSASHFRSAGTYIRKVIRQNAS